MKDYSYVTQLDYESVAGPDWPKFEQFQLNQSVPEWVYNEIDQILAPPQVFSHPSFCVLPFYGWEYPINQECCLMPRGSNIQTVQSSMLSGIRPAACSKCWALEDAGLASDRQLKNESLSLLFDTDINQLLINSQAGINFRAHYKIDTSTVCNATCITCGSGSSSSWAQLERKHGFAAKKTWQIRKETLPSGIDYSNAKTIGFRGGEPLLSDTNFAILEKLLENNNSDCFISFTTNGSLRPTKQQQHILDHFKNVNFCFSIDGVGPVFEYLRYPLSWGTLVSNINHVRDHGIHASVSYTLSNLNSWYHNETVQWFKEMNLDYIVNPVYSPEYFSPSALPKSIKQLIVAEPGNTELVHLLTHSDQDDVKFLKFIENVNRQDSWKGIKLRDYLPALAKALNFK
jgi:hypothetical protein